MRRRLTLLVAATMCLALLVFVVPLALLLRTVAQDRAVVAASAGAQSLVPVVGTADQDALRFSVEHMAAESRGPITVFLPDGSVLGTLAPRTSAVQLAARAGVSWTVERPDGREIVAAVMGRPDGTAVIRAFGLGALRLMSQHFAQLRRLDWSGRPRWPGSSPSCASAPS
ncbi:hypothetical protein ACFYZE_11460 [Streptomyces sp. NPDC001796]|uniref:hypothetical protein n=1 Tax=Streptomyces sp. NPDC001796 TaxID=3364609 RepID=UPI0036C7AEEE